MIILRMNENKVLSMTKNGNTYEDENNAETIRIILPKTLNGNYISDCITSLNILNQDILGDIIDVSQNLSEYNDDLFYCDIPVDNKFTYKQGTIKIWIEVLNSSSEMIAKTNSVSYTIKAHNHIEDFIPEQSLSLLEQWQVRMNELYLQVINLSNELKTIVSEIEAENKEISKFIETLKNSGEILIVRPDNGSVENE